MPIGDAYVNVLCDGCADETEVNRTALVRGAYDMRNVKSVLERQGWKVVTDLDGAVLCPSCLSDD